MKERHIYDNKKPYTPPETGIELMKVVGMMAGSDKEFDYSTSDGTEDALSNNSFWENESNKSLWDDGE